MGAELTVLALAALLQGVQFTMMSVSANLEFGPQKTLGTRDPSALGGDLAGLAGPRTGRLIRALDNHFEGLILFTIAVVVVTLGDQSSQTTRTAAWVYLIARTLYVPAYAFGWVPWRSLIWLVGFLATFTMILAALI